MTESAQTRGVVVGIDGSAGARFALKWAAEEARLRDLPLTVVMTWEYPVTYGSAAPWPGAVDFGGDAKHVVETEVAAVLGASPSVPVHQLVVEGHPAPVLLEQSKEAALLVVGSRGHGGFAGLLLGSVSEHLAAHAHCPVLIVHGRL